MTAKIPTPNLRENYQKEARRQIGAALKRLTPDEKRRVLQAAAELHLGPNWREKIQRKK